MKTVTQKQSYRQIPSADKKGLIALVVERCKRHLSRFPDSWGALLWLARAKTDLALYREAEKAIRQAQCLPCGRHWRRQRIAAVQMGHLFDAMGELKKASRWYGLALRADPKYGDCHIFLGHIAFKCGRLKQAEVHFRKAVRFRNCCVEEAYFNLGGILVAKRRYREAIKCYRKALAIDPQYPLAKKRLQDASLALQLQNS